jgi:hypothetical protein
MEEEDYDHQEKDQIKWIPVSLVCEEEQHKYNV